MDTNDSLIKEVANGNIEQVTNLLSLGADPNYTNSSNENSLIIASKNGNLAMVELLVENGADANTIENFHLEYDYDSEEECIVEFRTALSYAAEAGYLGIVKYLTEHGADISYGSCGRTALMYGAKHLDVVKYLIEKGADPNEMDSNWKSIVSFVSGPNREKIIKYLIDNGLDIELKNNDDQTLLVQAALEKDVDLVRILIKYGANVNATEDDETSPLIQAIDYISDTGNREVYYALSEVIKLFIDAGADVNYKNLFDERALQTLAKAPFIRGSIAKILIDNGATDEDDSIFNKLLRSYEVNDLYVAYLLSKGDEEKVVQVIKQIKKSRSQSLFALYATAVGDLEALIFVKENFDITFNTIITGAGRGPEMKSRRGMRREKFYLESEIVDNEGRYTLLSTSAFNDNLEITRYIYETVLDEFIREYNGNDQKIKIELLKYLIRQTSIKENALSIAYELCNKRVFNYLYRHLDQFSPSVKDELYVKYFSRVETCKDLDHVIVEFSHRFK